MVDPHFSFGVTRVTPKLFSRQITGLLSIPAEFMTITRYLTDAVHENKIALTFDDGYESVYQHAFPILRQLDIQATVFINPAFVGQFNTWDVNLGYLRFRHMNWRQLQQLQSCGWEIGIHGFSHQDLSRLPESVVKKEIALALCVMNSRLQSECRVISFPFGNVNETVARVGREQGLTAGLTMSRRPKNVDPAFSVTRLGVYPFDGRHSLRYKALRRGTTVQRMMQKVMDVCSDFTVFVKQKNWNID